MGVFRVAFTWIRRNMIRFPNRMMMYMPRNTKNSSVCSWGSLVRPKSSNSVPWLRFAPSIFLKCSGVWKVNTTRNEVAHPRSVPGFSFALQTAF